MEIEVTRDVLDAMGGATVAAHPREACGILLGKGHRITAFASARNIHPAPESHFEIDPQALIDAHRAMREGGPDVIGYFHSHPAGAPEPSATDCDQAARDGSIWAIMAGRDLRFFVAGESGFEPLSFTQIDG